MNQTHEGTTIGIKPSLSKHHNQQNVEEVKASGNHLSGKQPDYQNPEGPPETEKTSEERRSVIKLWSEMTRLKKGLFIGGIFLAITLIILFTLLIVAIRTKPRLRVQMQEAYKIPNSNEVLQNYHINGVKPSMISTDKTTNFTMTTIVKDQKARLLQEGEQDDPTVTPVILSFDFPGEGVNIRATSADDLIVQVDMDEMFGSYQNRRLLFQAEMAVALRTLQENDDQGGPLAFSDPDNIREDAINSLLKAVGHATSEDPDYLQVQQIENVNLLRQSDGSYLIEEEGQSSRLLQALSSLRGLQEWQPVFNEVYDAILVPKIVAVKTTINDLILDGSVDIDNLDVRKALRNSNFQDGIAVDVIYEDQEITSSRLLQDTEVSVPAPSLPSDPAHQASQSSSSPTQKAKPNTMSSSKEDQKKSDSTSDSTSKGQSSKEKQVLTKGKKRQGRRPIDNNKRGKSTGKRLRSATTTESAVNFTLYCSGRADNITCSTSVANNSASPIKIRANNSTNEGKQDKSTKKKKIFSVFKSKDKKIGKKRAVDKRKSSNKNKNLITQPAKDQVQVNTPREVLPANSNDKTRTKTTRTTVTTTPGSSTVSIVTTSTKTLGPSPPTPVVAPSAPASPNSSSSTTPAPSSSKSTSSDKGEVATP